MTKKLELMQHLLHEEEYGLLNLELCSYLWDSRTTFKSFKRTMNELFRDANEGDALEVALNSYEYGHAITMIGSCDKADKALGIYLLYSPGKQYTFRDRTATIQEISDDVSKWKKSDNKYLYAFTL